MLPKLAAGRPAEGDDLRLLADAGRRLSAAGFALRIVPQGSLPRLVARRGRCMVTLWNGDRGKELTAVFAATVGGATPIRFIHDGRLSPGPPGFGAELRRSLVNRLTAFGLVVGRSASLALATPPRCAAQVAGMVGPLTVWPASRRSQSGATAEPPDRS